MANLVKSYDYSKNQKQILIGMDSYYIAMPAIINGTAGEKAFAGQPLAGDITDRDTGFSAVTGEAVGVLLHDVVFDEDGKANGTLVLAACVDLLKLEDAVVTAIESSTGLDRIIFVKGSAI